MRRTPKTIAAAVVAQKEKEALEEAAMMTKDEETQQDAATDDDDTKQPAAAESAKIENKDDEESESVDAATAAPASPPVTAAAAAVAVEQEEGKEVGGEASKTTTKTKSMTKAKGAQIDPIAVARAMSMVGEHGCFLVDLDVSKGINSTGITFKPGPDGRPQVCAVSATGNAVGEVVVGDVLIETSVTVMVADETGESKFGIREQVWHNTKDSSFDDCMTVGLYKFNA